MKIFVYIIFLCIYFFKDIRRIAGPVIAKADLDNGNIFQCGLVYMDIET